MYESDGPYFFQILEERILKDFKNISLHKLATTISEVTTELKDNLVCIKFIIVSRS